MWKLAENIGITTNLEYDQNGLLDVDFEVLNKSFWDDERPIFFMEQKKVLDIIYALLLLSIPEKEDAMTSASFIYSQKESKLNDPILKTMCHGPDFDEYASPNECDIDKDKSKNRLTFVTSIKHNPCGSFRRSDHWTYTHGEDDFCEDIDENMILNGPVSLNESEPLVYPCNLQHCRVSCKCRFCHISSDIQCKHHKEHLKFNVKDCVIQKQSQCQIHWIDHPDNFNKNEDIQVKKNVLFHNNAIFKHGQIYHLNSIQYAGLKISCQKCKDDCKEHFVNHLSPHLQCKHCLHELKTMGDNEFWEKVCSICGKEFKSISAKKEHVARHAVSSQMCNLCDKVFSTKFNLERHINEEHTLRDNGSSDDENVVEDSKFICNFCGKGFRHLRNMNSHIDSIHRSSVEFKCKVCGREFRRASNLKVHLKMQHKILETQIVVEAKMPPSEPIIYTCETCSKVFSFKSNLKRHIEETHENKGYNCDFCDKSYLRKETLVLHIKKHHDT